MAGGARGAERLDALLERGQVLRPDRLEQLRVRGLEEERVGVLAELGPALEPGVEGVAQPAGHVLGVPPVAVERAEVELAVAVRDLRHRRLESAELALDGRRAGV